MDINKKNKELKKELKKASKWKIALFSICLIGILYNAMIINIANDYDSIQWNYGVGVKDGKVVELPILLKMYTGLFKMTIVGYEKPIYDSKAKEIILPSVEIKNDDSYGMPGFYKIKVYTRNACSTTEEWDIVGETQHIVLYGGVESGVIRDIRINNLPDYPINIKMELLFGVASSVGPIPTPVTVQGVGLGSYTINDTEYVRISNAGGTFYDPRQELGIVGCKSGETPTDPEDPSLDTNNPKIALYVNKGQIVENDEFEIAVETREGLNLKTIDAKYTIMIDDEIVCSGKTSYGTASCKIALGEDYLGTNDKKKLTLKGEVVDSKDRIGTTELGITLLSKDAADFWDGSGIDLLAQICGLKDGRALKQWVLEHLIMAVLVLIAIGIVALMLLGLFFRIMMGG